MTNTAKGLLITAFGVFIMSFESLLIKLSNLDPFTFSFYLGIFMFISMFTVFLFQEKSVKKEIYKPNFIIVLFGILCMAIANLLFIAAIKNTLAANVVLIIASGPLFTSLFAFLIYRVKPEKNIFIASFFIFVGLFIIFSSNIAYGNSLGNIYALLCTALFSIFFVLLGRYPDFDRVLIVSLAGLILAIFTYFLSDKLNVSLNNLLFVSIMGIFVTPISRVLITQGTKYISASEVSLLLIIETVMAPIWVWIFLKEIPPSNTFLGGAIIIITLILNSYFKMRKR